MPFFSFSVKVKFYVLHIATGREFTIFKVTKSFQKQERIVKMCGVKYDSGKTNINNRYSRYHVFS
jgi:hypothetical protein